MEMHKAISYWGNIKNKHSNKTGFSKQTIKRHGLSDSCELLWHLLLVFMRVLCREFKIYSKL